MVVPLSSQQATQDLLVLVDNDGRRIMGVCLSEQTSLLQMTHAFVGYANRHSSYLSDDAALIVVKALKETFPCPRRTGLMDGALAAAKVTPFR